MSSLLRRDFVPGGKIGNPLKSSGPLKCEPTNTSSLGDYEAPYETENLVSCWGIGGLLSFALNDWSGS